MCDATQRTVRVRDSQFVTALMDFYLATHGNGWERNNNWTDGDPCEAYWEGVGCDDAFSTVLSLCARHLLTLPTR